MSNTWQESIAEIGRLIRDGETSAEEIARTYLQRIERFNPGINCFLSVEAEAALDRARQADLEIRHGKDRGPLHGIPVAIKDIFERRGHTVSAGSKPFAFRSSRTATVVERLHAAGAVILGTLNLDEFAAGGTGANRHFGRCTNPWNSEYETGGSSGGCAAAVAAGLAPAAIGSDAGGSIRIPAAYCGVTGIKPTYGRVSRFGAVPRTWSMDCIGPLARTAEDCAAVLAIISGPDANDTTSLGSRPLPCPDSPGHLQGVRIGVDSGSTEPTDDAVERSFDDATRMFKELGAIVTAVKVPDGNLLNDLQQVIVKSEAAALHGKKLRQRPQDLSDEIKGVIQEGFAIPATAYIEALSLRAGMLAAFNRSVFAHCDALLLPATPNAVPRYEPAPPGEPGNVDKHFSECARFTRFANYLGLPGVAFPCGEDANSMPVGMQLIGPTWSESRLLDAVHAAQQVVDYRYAAAAQLA